MSRKTTVIAGIIILLVVAAVGLGASIAYYSDLPDHLSQHETIVLGQSTYVPGSQAALRVLVRDSKDGGPVQDAQINISMRPEEGGPVVSVFKGRTDKGGSTNVTFKVPDTDQPAQTLVVETRSTLGSDTIERPVTVQRENRILLTTDKPIYQPGQEIHLRALALSSFDLVPASGQSLEVTIADGKGNKVFRKTLRTSAYGVAAADFQLASEVNAGAYKITAQLGEVSSEKTVTVENYLLPKFEVSLKADKTFYLPGQHVSGALKAGYFFGKPVAGGKVTLEGFTFDVERTVAVTLQGQTDGDGNFVFEFNLPGYIAGTELNKDAARFYLQATVIDQAQATETANLSLPVAGSSLLIDAIPEGGQFKPGIENWLYVLTSYPDGSPAETSITVTFLENNARLTMDSGAYGLANFNYTPGNPNQSLTIEARDGQGNTATRSFVFQGKREEETILVRPEFPVYRVGDSMNLHLLTSKATGTVYLDIVRSGQTVSTRSVEMTDGKADITVDLTPDMFGTLELNAYKILSSGATVRDTRLVVVDPADALKVDVIPGKETYLPGDAGQLGIQVQGSDGNGTQSALGIAIVDESVFALAEQDPGFAKLYFLLESELLQPRYDLHGYSLTGLVEGTVPQDDMTLRAAVNRAAQASLAASVVDASGFSLQANSRQDNLNKAQKLQADFFTALGKAAFGVMLAIPLVMLGLNGFTLWRQRVLGRSFLLTLGFLALAVLLVLFWPLGSNSPWVRTPFDRLNWLFDVLSSGGIVWLGVLGLISIAGILALTVYAIRKKEASVGWTIMLLLLLIGDIFIIASLTTRMDSVNGDLLVILAVFGFFFVPFTFLLRFSGFLWKGQVGIAFAILPLVLFLVVGSMPVLGIAFSVRSGAIFNNQVMMLDAAALPPRALPLPGESAQGTGGGPESTTGTASTAEPPRLRQYFPETMLWLPEAVTDENGRLAIDVPVADSITTWRITALASTQDGRLGSTTAPLRVFQDFFIDLNLPPALTVGDEISIPVGIFNYLAQEQGVRLEVAKAEWFELVDEPVKEITIAANEVSVVYFRIRATRFGIQQFKVTALGIKLSDAIQKEVQVYPDGKQIRFSQADRLEPGTPARQGVTIPADTISGTQTLLVKIYPGMLSQVVEGMDSILRMPFGCFEQTSSTTYPNVLALDYLKSTNQAAPEIRMKAEQYINLGYQRLATFEVKSSGGFSLFGNEPADRMLTAYGLQEFSDMSRVYEIDADLVRRAADWLLSQQEADGTWKNDRGLVHENTWQQLENDRLPVTAYIVWSLVDAGFENEGGTKKGLDYVREFERQASDPYVLALVANALVAGDLKSGTALSPSTEDALSRLAGMAQRDGDSVFWSSKVATFMGGKGDVGSIETTALAALALMRGDRSPELANGALTFLIKQKDDFGTWHSTQATVLSLKALLQNLRSGTENVNATVTVTLNGSQAKTVKVNPENFDVVQLLSFEDINPGAENTIEINVEGQGNLMYQLSGSYYLPWDKLAAHPELTQAGEKVSIDVAYDRAQLAVDDTVNVMVTVRLNEAGAHADQALIDLGIPPGFSVVTDDLTALVKNYKDVPADYAFPLISRYEMTGRQVLIYANNLSSAAPLTFTYRMQARFPLKVQSPASSAYDYYNPGINGEQAPQELVVLLN